MKKIFLALLVIVAVNSNIYAQYTNDALRFSQTNFGSTARFKAMGNAQIGVGGDISSLGGNPAGLGLFTKSEFSFTPEFNGTKANASYLDKQTNTNKSQINANQIGAVFFAPNYKQRGQETTKGLISAVFGLGYNRNNDFSTEINYNGSNTKTSMADYFAEIAGKTLPNKLANGSLERMAYDNYLISYDNVAGNYYPETFADNTQPSQQKKNELRSGSVSEFNFAVALNISNQIYIGANLGLVDIRYTSDAQYEEAGKLHIADQPISATKNYKFLFNQNQTTKGSGANGRLGIIFRPEKNFRIGATLQTPTWLVINDSYTEGLDNRGTTNGTSNKETYDFSYNLRTPLKGALGASYIIANRAILTADVDFIDYSTIKFSTSEGYATTDDVAVMKSNNTGVRQNYRNAINYRVGAEYKIDKVSLRAGYGLNGSPYKTDENNFFETKVYSGGLGYRVNNYFLDLTYQKIQGNNSFSPYTLNAGNEPVATIKNEKTNVFLTFGLRF
jgi:hypothetical protein